MEIKVTLDLNELREKLCEECQKKLDDYLKELAVAALQKGRKEKSDEP